MDKYDKTFLTKTLKRNIIFALMILQFTFYGPLLFFAMIKFSGGDMTSLIIWSLPVTILNLIDPDYLTIALVAILSPIITYTIIYWILKYLLLRDMIPLFKARPYLYGIVGTLVIEFAMPWNVIYTDFPSWVDEWSIFRLFSYFVLVAFPVILDITYIRMFVLPKAHAKKAQMS